MHKRELLYINNMFHMLAVSISHAVFVAADAGFTLKDVAETAKTTTRHFDTIHDKIVADDTIPEPPGDEP